MEEVKRYAQPGKKYNITLPNGEREEWDIKGVNPDGRISLIAWNDRRRRRGKGMRYNMLPDKFMSFVATDPMTSIVFERSNLFSPEVMTNIANFNQSSRNKRHPSRRRGKSRYRRKHFRSSRRKRPRSSRRKRRRYL